MITSGPRHLSSIGHASFFILKKGGLGCGERQTAPVIGERRKGGQRATLAAGQVSESHICQAPAWVEQPASQWLSCCLQKLMSILAMLDAFCTYKAQSEATGNICRINTRGTASVVQRLSALFMLGNCWKYFTTSSSSINHKDKQSIFMHKEEKEKS